MGGLTQHQTWVLVSKRDRKINKIIELQLVALRRIQFKRRLFPFVVNIAPYKGILESLAEDTTETLKCIKQIHVQTGF